MGKFQTGTGRERSFSFSLSSLRLNKNLSFCFFDDRRYRRAEKDFTKPDEAR